MAAAAEMPTGSQFFDLEGNVRLGFGFTEDQAAELAAAAFAAATPIVKDSASSAWNVQMFGSQTIGLCTAPKPAPVTASTENPAPSSASAAAAVATAPDGDDVPASQNESRVGT